MRSNDTPGVDGPDHRPNGKTMFRARWAVKRKGRRVCQAEQRRRLHGKMPAYYIYIYIYIYSSKDKVEPFLSKITFV